MLAAGRAFVYISGAEHFGDVFNVYLYDDCL